MRDGTATRWPDVPSVAELNFPTLIASNCFGLSGPAGIPPEIALRINEAANPANVVLNLPLQLLTGGNLQAHYDQPHS